jgi:4'-phosphopantetheinyl transferase
MRTATPVRPVLPTVSLTDAFKAVLHEGRGTDSLVFVGLFELDDWWPWLDDAARLIDDAEQRRAQARRQPVDRDRLILCYALHRLLLGQFLRCDATTLPLWRDPAGCPRVADGDIRTSLSHAGGCAAVAVTSSGPVGVDIEPAARAHVMADIVERLCHPEDMAMIGALHPKLRDQALLRLWVRKEAYLKAAGTGLQMEMNTFPAPQDAVLALPDGSHSRVRMLEAGSGLVAAGAAPPGVEFQATWLRAPAPEGGAP